MSYCTYCQSRLVRITGGEPAHTVEEDVVGWNATLRHTTFVPASVSYTCAECGRSGSVNI